jgi:hypothetical protein
MEENDLLAELNGVAANPQEAKELANAEAEAKIDPLAIVPKKRKSAVVLAKELANKEAPARGTSIKGYAVTVKGDYSVASHDSPGKKLKKPYVLTVNLPALEGALSTIKNKLLDKMLKMKYPGYLTYLTHEIVEARPLSADTPPAANVAYMTFADLVSLIASERMPILPSNYEEGDVVNLRAAVVDFRLNPKGFEAREEKRLAGIKEDKALEALNNIPSSTPSGVSMPE